LLPGSSRHGDKRGRDCGTQQHTAHPIVLLFGPDQLGDETRGRKP